MPLRMAPARVHTIFHAKYIEDAIDASSEFLRESANPGKKMMITHKMKPLPYGPSTTSDEICIAYNRYTSPNITAEFNIFGEHEDPSRYAMIEQVLFDLLSFHSEDRRTVRFVIKGRPSHLLSVLLKKSVDRYPSTLFVVATTFLSYVPLQSRFVSVAVKSLDKEEESTSKAFEIAEKFMKDVKGDVAAGNWNKANEKIHATSFKLCATSVDVARLSKVFLSIYSRDPSIYDDDFMRNAVHKFARVQASGMKSNKISLTFDTLLFEVAKLIHCTQTKYQV